MSPINFAKFRSDFPLLARKIHGKKLVYLDNAATTPKPWPVIERISHFYSYETANVHRGAHFLANQTTELYEQTRQRVARFLGAQSSEEIVFTKGATEAINLVASSWGRSHLQLGDEILLTEMEHHSNIVPWQMLAFEKKALIKTVRVTNQGEIDLEDLHQKISTKTKIFAFTACSNVLGTINDTAYLSKVAHEVGALALIDGAQAVANYPVNVQEMNADFFVFSGHKVFGPHGVGVLYGKSNLLETMPPYQGGGSMISEVSFDKTSYLSPPMLFEAGTPNIEGVVALATALEYVEKPGWNHLIQHEKNLLESAEKALAEIPEIQLIGQASQKGPVLSFVMRGTHHSDVAQILDQEGIAVRAGHHCAQPLMKRWGLTGTVRASFSLFNNMSDVNALVEGLYKAKGLLL